MLKTLTYSPSVTIPITRACANRCRYCAFREEGSGLLKLSKILSIASEAQKKSISEALLISGENVDRVPYIKKALESMGFSSIVEWTKMVCNCMLDYDLLPHVNIGLLPFDDLRELSLVSASMGLMMEGDYGELGSRIHPQKDFWGRIKCLEWAGELKIPFTTGILMGLGETQGDRVRSIEAILESFRRYGHVQEIILQPFVPNHRCPSLSNKVSKQELKEIVTLCKSGFPEIHVQLPFNLYDNWYELLELGFDDMGGISEEVDVMNPNSPWPPIDEVRNMLKAKNLHLAKRLPIYPKFYRQGWYSAKVGRVIEKWIKENNEYQYYTY